MGQIQVEEKKYSVEEYLKMEEESEIRHEFYDGEIFAMPVSKVYEGIVFEEQTSAPDMMR